MAVIRDGSSQFPFHITDVAALLRLNIRRRGPDFLYVDCPLCGDHRGKLYLKTSRDVWHCNYCQESGGMLALYAKVYGISNADAYREICEALQTGDYAPEYQSYQNQQPQEIAQSVRAPRQAIHQTLSMLFSMLSLTPKHRAHLREVRGLTDDQIERFGFKSTPPPYLCKSLTARLLKQGCTLQGVPGFYLAEDGRWTVRFGTRTAGILIPARSADGLVCGAQIRLDIPIREENAPADKEGTKYLWLSSSSKPMGTSSESPIHFVGDPCSRVVYVTEGLLKADICHALMNRTFAATAGANNVSKMDELFAFLKKNGTEEIIEAQDMDKYRNVHVEKGASKIYLMARKHGLQCRRLTWNPNYKGLDDWQLALRKNAGKAPKTMTFRERYLHGVCEVSEIDACVEQWHKTQPDGVPLQAYLGLLDEEYHAFLQPGGNAQLEELLNAQRKQLGCRIYQLEFTDTEKTKPFAFSGIDALHKAGFQQPPASEYRLVCDETLYLGTYTYKSHGAGGYGSGTCPDCGSHTWVLQSQQASTCTSNGYRSYSCACGQTKSETIYASGHNYNYGSWEQYSSSQHRRTGSCRNCGATDYDYASHSMSYGAWSNYSDSQHSRTASCRTCGYSTTDYGNHSYTTGSWSKYSDTQHRRSKTCSGCGASTYDYANHSYSYGSWVSDSETRHKRTKTCSACGDSGYEYADHTDANGDGKCDDCGATVSLTIKWDAGTNGGTIDGKTSITTTGKPNATATAPTSTPVKTGHAFKGWYTSASGGSLYNTVTITAAKTFYAQFTANSYTLTWDLGNGTTEETKQTYGEKLTLPTEPTRKNAEFLGWFTEVTGGTQVTANDAFTETADKTYYAHWEITEVFSVTVPVVLPLTVDENGEVHTGAAEIINASTGDVIVSSVSISTKNGWKLVPFVTDMAHEKVDARLLGFKINDSETTKTGDAETFSLNSPWTIAENGKLPLSYDAVVSAVSQPVTEQDVLSVVFVLEWKGE